MTSMSIMLQLTTRLTGPVGVFFLTTRPREYSQYSYAPIISHQDRTRYIAATFAVLRNYSSSRRTIGITWVAKASRVPLIPPSGEGDGRTNI